MESVTFIGTFDPMHGAHIGQLLRAYKYRPFSFVYILVNKRPAHKPNATSWQHRLAMAELTWSAFNPPFQYKIMAVENSFAAELQEAVDCKVTGIDSLIDNLSDEKRWPLAQRWPMIVLSIPGVEEDELAKAMSGLPEDIQKTMRYEYVGPEIPIMNYDFDRQAAVSRRIHSTGLRAGKDQSLIPDSVREYIHCHDLYADSA
jgi:nicotinic acid mononucleotide adenylyltransferase